MAGIDAGDAQGIDAGDALGIDAGDVAGIDAGDAQGIDAGDALGIDAGDALGIDAGDILAGPVSNIDRGNGVFHSLGQVVMASDEALSSMRVGDYVNVAGSVVAPGLLYADTVSVADVDYVPGATQVYVAGFLTDVNLGLGTARLGELTIDYTASLATGLAPSGAMWSFTGIVPSINNLMISERTDIHTQ